jgi:hypothetical protein
MKEGQHTNTCSPHKLLHAGRADSMLKPLVSVSCRRVRVLYCTLAEHSPSHPHAHTRKNLVLHPNKSLLLCIKATEPL